jgi:molybdate transport system substrate-binding protein
VRRPVRSLVTVLAGASLLLAGCGSSSSGAASSTSSAGSAAASSSASAPAVTGTVTVLAAASLTESFNTMKADFEKAHPGTTITMSFGASSTLATQIIQGAPADVFASAAPKNMQQVVDAKAAADPKTFAKNVLEVAVPASNPAKITQLSDLAKPGVKVALCGPQVPAGAGAVAIFKKANLTVKPATIEADVKAVLSKVTLGEADAGVVWYTDVLSAGAKAKGVQIPADLNISSDYPIAPLTASKNPALAKAFVDYVLSTDGANTLHAAGFEKP